MTKPWKSLPCYYFQHRFKVARHKFKSTYFKISQTFHHQHGMSKFFRTTTSVASIRKFITFIPITCILTVLSIILKIHKHVQKLVLQHSMNSSIFAGSKDLKGSTVKMTGLPSLSLSSPFKSPDSSPLKSPSPLPLPTSTNANVNIPAQSSTTVSPSIVFPIQQVADQLKRIGSNQTFTINWIKSHLQFKSHPRRCNYPLSLPTPPMFQTTPNATH